MRRRKEQKARDDMVYRPTQTTSKPPRPPKGGSSADKESRTMTRQEALHELYTIFGYGFYNERVDEALNMAIKALEQEPQEPCDKRTDKRTETHACDCISRQAAIDAMWKALYAYQDLTEKQFMENDELDLSDWFQHRIFVQRMHEECLNAIEALPSADRPTGHWIEHDDERVLCECSECHEKYLLYEEHVLGRNFCPNCGCAMKDREEE